MSLDSIVHITIDTKSLQMAQAGFGTPLIIAEHPYLKERVTPCRTMAEVFELRDKEKEEKLPDEQKFDHDPLYLTAQAIFSQKPTVRRIKLGKRDGKESVMEALEAISKHDADGDFYGVLLVTKKPEVDYPALANAVSTKRLLAGVDIELSQLDMLKGLKEYSGARRIFSILKDGNDNYPAAAWMGKMLAQPAGSASWAFKDLEGIKKCKISTHNEALLKEAQVNRHIDINNVGVTLDGKVSKGFLAADPEPEVSIPNLEDIEQAERNKRRLPDVCFSARLAGAIHEIEIHGTVTP